MNVLIVEDDKGVAAVMEQGLREDGHQVHAASDGAEGLSLIRTGHFDAAVLDVMLPKLDGFSVLKQVRRSGSTTPILLLTARSAAADVVRGLDLGADDYLSKPFHLDVFLARVRAVSRRGPIAQPSVLRAGNCSLDRGRRVLVNAGEEFPLTRKEFALLELLMRRLNIVATRDQLLEAAWGIDARVGEGNLDFYIHSLRAKLSSADAQLSIRTVRGLGYLLSA